MRKRLLQPEQIAAHKCGDSVPRDGYVERHCLCGVMFYRHKRSRQKLCCACKRTTVIESLPIKVSTDIKFQTMAEVDEYLGGETIRCLLCSGQYQILGRHLTGAHNITAREYKIRYGLPLSRPLSVQAIRDRFAERARKRIASGEMKTAADPEHARLIAQVPRAIVRPTHSPAAMASMLHGVKSRASRKLVGALCSQCGEDAGDREEHVIIKHGCRVLCRDCKRARHVQSEMRWLAKIGYRSKSEYMRELYLRKKKEAQAHA